MDVEVRTLTHAVHSGMWGGLVPDSLMALARLIERGGRLSALPGLYSTVAEVLATLVAYERLSISVFDADAGMKIAPSNSAL